MDKVPVSVIIPVKNERDNLDRCLRSVYWADEIFVVDSESADGTQSIARQHNATLVQFKFNGRWPKKKNWALDNLPLRNEWVFLLDADEVLLDDAKDEFMEICTRTNEKYDGYFINRKFMFMGKWLKHAYYPNWNLRLFKHALGRFEKITESATSSGDVEIHEHILLKGQSGFLNAEMEHYAFPTVEAFVNKHNRYSNWEAAIEAGANKLSGSCDLGSGKANFRRRIKHLTKRFPFRSLLRFVYVYFIQKGFLDGIEGYYFARLHAFYEFLCVSKAYELAKRKKQISR